MAHCHLISGPISYQSKRRKLLHFENRGEAREGEEGCLEDCLAAEDLNKIEKKMEEERHQEETQAKEQDFVTYHPPSYIWLMTTDGKNDSEQHLFYNLTEDRYYVQFVPELKNKYVACCYGGLLVLRDKTTYDCSILNILTMEKSQLPHLDIDIFHIECIISSPKMDGSCRVILFNRTLRKFWSCHLGDSEFIERDMTYRDGCIVRDLINFKGKLYALTSVDWNLIVSDFLDPELHHELVISGGESLQDLIFSHGLEGYIYLVESCEDLLLIYISSYDHEVSYVTIFKADFISGEWVKMETLDGRAIFLAPLGNNFSYPATAVGMKGNAVYWVRSPFCWIPPDRYLYMYDIEDKSISMSLPFPIVGTYSSLSWVSFPMSSNEEKKSEHKDMRSLFEAYPTETNFHLQRRMRKAITESMERNTQKREETEARVPTIVRKESLWTDLHNDLLQEIFPHLFAGETVVFRSVCRWWYSVSPPLPSKTTQKYVLPLKSSECSSPLLICPGNKAYNPIHGKLYSTDFPDIPGAIVRAGRDGWLLMEYYSIGLFIYNPFTKAEIILPNCNARLHYSVYFSAPPMSADCLIVAAAWKFDNTVAIFFMKWGDEDWTCHELSPEEYSFDFSYCNAAIYKGRYYFLGNGAELIIFNPEKDEIRVIKAPKFIFDLKAKGGQQYLLESDGKLIAVFVATGGTSVYTCEWNVSLSEWEILGSLGNIMLFVSRPLSIWRRATVSGTGNKIYFPRVVGDQGQILFYSLATKRYHTFEMGTSYSHFFASKFYPQYNGWFTY